MALFNIYYHFVRPKKYFPIVISALSSRRPFLQKLYKNEPIDSEDLSFYKNGINYENLELRFCKKKKIPEIKELMHIFFTQLDFDQIIRSTLLERSLDESNSEPEFQFEDICKHLALELQNTITSKLVPD